MSGRLRVAIAGLFLALAVGVWLRAAASSSASLQQKSPGTFSRLSGSDGNVAAGATQAGDRDDPATRWYAVDISRQVTVVELPADCQAGCDLIVSSLGESQRTFHVQLQATSDNMAERAALTRLGSFPPRKSARAKRHLTAGRSFDPATLSLRPLLTTGAPVSTSGPSAPAEADLEANPDSATCARSVQSAEPRTADVCAEMTAARTFYLHVADLPLEDPRGYTSVTAKLAAEGTGVRVYRDAQLQSQEVAPGLEAEVVRLLDEQILPRSREILGLHRDVDGDGRLAVLLTPWLGKLQGGRTSVNGFVRSSDFQAQGRPPFSNQADVLYLNSAIAPGPALAALLAHEYTHAVCCSLRSANERRPYGLAEEQDWLNEALAHVAERLHGAGWSNLDHRVAGYLDSPASSPLVVRDYYRAGLWRDPACRGATYLFLQWCVDTWGTELLQRLADDPRIGIEKLEALTGESFAALYRRWTIALAEERLPSLELRGRLGTRDLSGPHRQEWSAADGTCDLELRGTATAFVRWKRASPADGRRITITADRGARLQVTLLSRTSVQ